MGVIEGLLARVSVADNFTVINVLVVGGLTAVAYAGYRFLTIAGFPHNSPKFVKGVPLLGSLDFYRIRRDFIAEHTKPGCDDGDEGCFSFFFGVNRIVALAGDVGKHLFLTSRDLDVDSAYATLFTGVPSVNHLARDVKQEEAVAHMMAIFKKLLAKPRLANLVPKITHDTRAAYADIDINGPVDPFAVMNKLIFQITIRAIAADEFVEDKALFDKTMNYYSYITKASGLDVMFPHLPTIRKLVQMAGATKLFMIVTGIIHKRRKAGESVDDSLQVMIDAGLSDHDICLSVIRGLVAGFINSSVFAGWIPAQLDKNPEWKARVKAEVDGVVEKYRKSPAETPVDILSSLTIDEWDAEFPNIDLCLRESIRRDLPGTMLRKNISGSEIVIPGTNKVIPNDTFVIYPIQDSNMNPDIYANPEMWDPSRFLPDRAEDKKSPFAFVGWGAGLHPCLGTRLAKLEITIVVALFVATYDFELVNLDGTKRTEPLPTTNYNSNIGVEPMTGKMFLKLQERFAASG